LSLGQTKALHSALFKSRIAGRDLLQAPQPAQKCQRISIFERYASLEKFVCRTMSGSAEIDDKLHALSKALIIKMETKLQTSDCHSLIVPLSPRPELHPNVRRGCHP